MWSLHNTLCLLAVGTRWFTFYEEWHQDTDVESSHLVCSRPRPRPTTLANRLSQLSQLSQPSKLSQLSLFSLFLKLSRLFKLSQLKLLSQFPQLLQLSLVHFLRLTDITMVTLHLPRTYFRKVTGPGHNMILSALREWSISAGKVNEVFPKQDNSFLTSSAKKGFN